MSSSCRQARLLTAHYALFQSGASLAGGFLGAFLLNSGFSIAAALVAYACYLSLRTLLRFAALEVVRRVGYRPAIVLGTGVIALQFVPLLHAERPAWLALWMLCIALGEALYWPIYHALVAVSGHSATRGRQVGLRTTIGALIGVTAPLLGAGLLGHVGPVAHFGLAAALTLLAILPLLALRAMPAGPVPAWRGAMRDVDAMSMLAFVADGWLCAGLALAWPMILFTSVGSQYGVLGAQNAVAGMIGALASYCCGRGVDRGQRHVYLNTVCLLLVAGILLRAAAAWSPLSASLANVSGAVTGVLYNVVLMSVIYDRAKRSGAAFRFHFAAEAGWDAGAVAGCLATALTAALCSDAPSLAVLPALAGVALSFACVRAGQSAPLAPVLGEAVAA